MGRARLAALLGLAAMLAGCSILHLGGGGGPAQKSEPPTSKRLVGRVLTATPIGVLAKGDVEQPWFSYAVEPENAIGAQVVVLGDRVDCPLAGDADQAWLMVLKKQSVRFARPKKDKALVSDLVITTCAPIAR